MGEAIRISDSVYWVGAFDWKLRNFHGIATPEGGTYNSYLILDDKTALIDTVKRVKAEEHIERIRSVTDPNEIDYVVSNHSEFDHSGAIPEVMEHADKAELVTTEKAVGYLSRIYGANLPFVTVKDGDEIELGKSKLRFIEAPMLHWPETMMTYIRGGDTLFSCDLFGAQVADSRIYADLNPKIMDYAKSYYALIFRPFTRAVLNGLKKLEGLEIEVIAPSHGPVWRRNAHEIVDAYFRWSTKPERNRVVILYAGIWGGTRGMAEAIVEGFTASGIEVKIYDLTELNWSQWGGLMADFMEAKAIAIGSHTFLGQPFPNVKVALNLLRIIRPEGKTALLFGTYGWSGGALKAIAEELKSMKMDLIEPFLDIQFVPHKDDLKKCIKFGKHLAEKIKD